MIEAEKSPGIACQENRPHAEKRDFSSRGTDRSGRKESTPVNSRPGTRLRSPAAATIEIADPLQHSQGAPPLVEKNQFFPSTKTRALNFSTNFWSWRKSVNPAPWRSRCRHFGCPGGQNPWTWTWSCRLILNGDEGFFLHLDRRHPFRAAHPAHARAGRHDSVP